MVNARKPPLWRMFLAVWPDAALRDAIACWLREWTWPPGAAVVPADRLHLTLHFLGNVPTDRLPALVGALRVPFEPFDLLLDSARVWPRGLAVLRPRATPPALEGLHERLAAALAAAGVPVENRPYKAHVTLARRAAGASPPPAAPAFAWRADAGFVLVRSLPDGAGYEVVERFS